MNNYASCKINQTVHQALMEIYQRSMSCEDVTKIIAEVQDLSKGQKLKEAEVTCEIVKTNDIVANNADECPVNDFLLHPAIHNIVTLRCFNHKTKNVTTRRIETFLQCQI